MGCVCFHFCSYEKQIYVHYYPYIMHLCIILLFCMKSIVLKDERERKKKRLVISLQIIYILEIIIHIALLKYNTKSQYVITKTEYATIA